jgi:hypothetical protein
MDDTVIEAMSANRSRYAREDYAPRSANFNTAGAPSWGRSSAGGWRRGRAKQTGEKW